MFAKAPTGKASRILKLLNAQQRIWTKCQAPFDASICRLGLMLFPSPAEALLAVQRVLKPGARFAALVFTTPANNPFVAQPMGILLRHAGKQPPAAGQPGLFALGSNGVLESLLKDSGLVDVKTKTIQASLSLPSATDALDMMQQAFGGISGSGWPVSARSKSPKHGRKCLNASRSLKVTTASKQSLNSLSGPA